MRCGNARIGGTLLGSALAGLACWAGALVGTGAGVGTGTAADDPATKPKPKTKEAREGKSALAARAQLADQLALTPMQRAAWARSTEELDAQRAALLAGLEPKLAELRRTLTDDAAAPEARKSAVERIDEIHQAFRKIEAERKSRLEELLSDDQKHKLEELMHPAPGEGPFIREGLQERINRSVRRLGLSAEQTAEVRKHREALDRKLGDAEKGRQAAVDEFHKAVIPVIKDDAQRLADWDAQRAEWERPRRAKPNPPKGGDKPVVDKTPAAKLPSEKPEAPVKP